jgi:hypothetical protein
MTLVQATFQHSPPDVRSSRSGTPPEKSGLRSDLVQSSSSPTNEGPPSPHSTLLSPKLPYPNIEPTAFRVAYFHVLQLSSDQVVHSNESLDEDILVKCKLTIKDFAESLRAYFDILGEFHPCIPEDAFWEDFRAA